MSQIRANNSSSDASVGAGPAGPRDAQHAIGSSLPEHHQTTGYLLVLLGPILAVGAFTALLAMGVGL